MLAIINELPDFLEIFFFHEFRPSTWLMMIITPFFTSLGYLSGVYGILNSDCFNGLGG